MAPKPLSDYPRPPQDNGRGVHWSANVYHPDGDDLQFWINELKAMQIKWVKALDDGGGSSVALCRALLANDIMPVIRIYRERPNPGHLGGREIDAVRQLIDAGVRYFETNNEPDLPAEWQNNHCPDNWLDIVVDNFIYDADVIQELGGLPAFPAMGPGSNANGIARVVERGRIDIFEKGAWLAIHNYTLNHPLDYPYDPVNQEGQPLTQEAYDRLAAWQYSHLSWDEIQALGIEISREDYDKFNRWAWNGRTLEQVNAVRAAHKNPGATIFDDASCYRAWELFGSYVHDVLGFYIPIISTEGGPVVGWGDDDRYAKVNPATQAEWQREIVRFLQDEAPPWYFTTCTWLLASAPMGDYNPAWDQMSWYTHAWDLQFGLEGQLPIVQWLKDMPAQIRHEMRPPGGSAAVAGTITDEAGQPLPGVTLTLRTLEGRTAARALSDDEGHYELIAEPGLYDLYAPWWGVLAADITLDVADVDMLTLQLPARPGLYEISGVVKDADQLIVPEAPVSLQRHGLVHAQTKTDALGKFSFHPGLSGVYWLITEGAYAQIELTPAAPVASQELVVAAAPTLRYVLTEKRLLSPEETANRELFYGFVRDASGQGLNGIELEMRWTGAAPGTVFPRTTTGSDVGKPAGYYEFLHTKGEFMIQVVQGDYESDIADGLDTAHVPGREGQPITYEVDFQLLPVETPAPQGVISGSVPGGRVEQAVYLWRDGTMLAEASLNFRRQFRFEGLTAGVYDVELAGVGLIATELALADQAQRALEFPLLGALIGRVDGASAGSIVKLISETYGFVRHAELTQDGQYRFTNLPAGQYRIELDDDILTDLTCDGQRVLEAPVLQVGMSNAVQRGRIVGVVRDMANQPVAGVEITLLFQGYPLTSSTTDSAGQFTFGRLGPGVYDLSLANEVALADIVSDGEHDLSVSLLYAPLAQAPQKQIGRYYLLQMADPALLPALIRLLAPWLPTQPRGVVGASITEALSAHTVVLLGDGLPDSGVTLLQNAGCDIVDMRSDLLSLARTLAASPSVNSGESS